jgi:hypothetical protein
MGCSKEDMSNIDKLQLDQQIVKPQEYSAAASLLPTLIPSKKRERKILRMMEEREKRNV